MTELMDIVENVHGKAVIWSHYTHDVRRIIEEIKRVDVNQAAALKVFMGASTGEMLVDSLAHPLALRVVLPSTPAPTL